MAVLFFDVLLVGLGTSCASALFVEVLGDVDGGGMTFLATFFSFSFAIERSVSRESYSLKRAALRTLFFLVAPDFVVILP